MSDTTVDTQVDTPVTVTPSPLDMPGARKEPLVPVVESEDKPAPAPKAETVEPQQDTLTAQERDELERLRNFRKQSRDWEKTAKQNYEDAQRFRQLAVQFGNGEEGEVAAPGEAR